MESLQAHACASDPLPLTISLYFMPSQSPQVPGTQHSELAQALMLFIPTAFDLIATVLMNVGLLSGQLDWKPCCSTCLYTLLSMPVPDGHNMHLELTMSLQSPLLCIR